MEYSSERQERPDRALVRAKNLVGNGKEKGTPTLNGKLYSHAMNFGRDPAMDVATIAGALAGMVAANMPMFPDEYNQLIRDQRIVSECLVNPFIESIAGEDPEASQVNAGEEEKAVAREEVKVFLSEGWGGQDQESLHNYIQELRLQYPGVRFSEILNEADIRKQMELDVERSLQSTAKPILMDKIRDDAFILNYFSTRVISLKDGQIHVDVQKMQELVDHISEAGYRLENLYPLLEKEFAAFAVIGRKAAAEQEKARENIDENVQSVRSAVKKVYADSALKELCIFNFETDPKTGRKLPYDEFFWEHIVPRIEAAPTRKLPSRPRLVDLWTFFHNLDKVIVSDRIFDPLREVLNWGPEDFMSFLRQHFNFDGWPGISENITDPQVKALLACQAKNAHEYPAYNLKWAFWEDGGDEKKSIKEKYEPYKEITECHDIKKLWEYIAYPEKFFEDHPHHFLTDGVMGKIQKAKVRQDTVAIVINFFRRRKRKARKMAGKTAQRDLEAHLRYTLGINREDEKEILVYSRPRIKLMPGMTAEESLELYNKGKYAYTDKSGKTRRIPDDILIGPEDFSEAFDSRHLINGNGYGPDAPQGKILYDQELLHMHPDKYVTYSDGHDRYLLFPMAEPKKMVLASCRPRKPNGKQNGTHKILFWYGQDSMVHQKSDAASASAEFRKNHVNDKNRITKVALTVEGYQATTDALYINYSSVHPEKITDADEQRTIVGGEKGKRENTASVIEDRPIAGDFYALKPDVVRDENTVVDEDGNVINKQGEIIGKIDDKGNFWIGEAIDHTNEKLPEDYGNQIILFEVQGETVRNAMLGFHKDNILAHDRYKHKREHGVLERAKPIFLTGEPIPKGLRRKVEIMDIGGS